MKRAQKWIVFGLIIAMLLPIGALFVSASADPILNSDTLAEFQVDGYRFKKEGDGEINFTEYYGTDTVLQIPDTVNGDPVVNVGIPYAGFIYGDEESLKKVTGIEIPKTVQSIYEEAFYFFPSLMDISMPDNVSIGREAFDNTAYYKNPDNWENGVLYIDGYLIKAKGVKGTYTVKQGTRGIADSAFEDCSELEKIIIPDSVTIIGYLAFDNCSSLKEISIGSNVRKIGWGAFYNTAYFENPGNWNDGVLYLGNYLIAADRDTVGEYGEVRQGTTVIAEEAFSYCKSLKKVILPNGLMSIPEFAFENAALLEEVVIPNSVCEVAEYAFWKCENLRKVVLPATDCKVKYGAFAYCDNLSEVVFQEGLKEIPYGAFCGTPSLTSVTIPKSVEKIDDNAFFLTWENKDAFTVYGYPNTEAEAFAVRNALTFVPLESISRDFNHAESGVSVTVINAEVLSEDTALHVVVEEQTKNRVTYNITLVSNGMEIQPAGEVTVRIPVPDTMDENTCKVYRAETDGTLTDMHAIYQDGYMVFTTDHFSRYLLTEEVMETSSQLSDITEKNDGVDTNTPNIPQTNGSSIAGNTLAAFAMLSMAACAFMLDQAMKKKKN